MYQFRNLELLFGREASRLKSIAMDMATATETTASADTKRVLIYRLDAATGKLAANDPAFARTRRGAGLAGGLAAGLVTERLAFR